MKKTILITLFVLTLAILSAGGYNEYYFNFKIRDYADLSRLGEIVSIDKIEGFMVYAYANDDEWAEFQKTNYNTHLLPHPGINPDAKMAESKAQMREWDAYPTYQAYVDMMYGFAQDYPALCRIVDAGITVGGRKILFAVISDNVSQREAEPRLMYTSTMHGDETVGYILMLRLIDTLLSGYEDDPRLTNLVNNGEIWINPNANPDGTYYGGNNTVSSSRRYNQNGYDLNRNYPSPTGSQYTGQPLQTETSLMMTLGLQERFHLVANFHGGAEVVNYPWDHKYDLHVDDAWYQTISREYATSAQNHGPAGYMDDLENGITNGASWYVTTGNRQDWTNYAARGREVTIEVSTTKNPAASTLPGFWNYNLDALLGFLEQGTYGIHGSVKDAWGNPLSATITVMNHDDELSTVQSIPTSGTYFRHLIPGEYSLRISTPGYEDIIINNVVVSSGVSTLVETIFGNVPSILEIPLETGWNMVSFNVLPENSAEVISTIGHLQQIKNLSHSYNPELPAKLNTLSNLEHHQGYYLKVSAPSLLRIEGSRGTQTAINLAEGWNFVSFLPEEPMSVSAALASIMPYLIDVRTSNISYAENTLTTMQAGRAYWIHVNQDCVLQYP